MHTVFVTCFPVLSSSVVVEQHIFYVYKKHEYENWWKLLVAQDEEFEKAEGGNTS